MLLEKTTPLIGEQSAVGLYAVVDDSSAGIFALKVHHAAIKRQWTHERLPAVPCEQHLRHALRIDIALNEKFKHGVIHKEAPRTGGIFIYVGLLKIVAVLTVKIAHAACRLRHYIKRLGKRCIQFHGVRIDTYATLLLDALQLLLAKPGYRGLGFLRSIGHQFSYNTRLKTYFIKCYTYELPVLVGKIIFFLQSVGYAYTLGIGLGVINSTVILGKLLVVENCSESAVTKFAHAVAGLHRHNTVVSCNKTHEFGIFSIYGFGEFYLLLRGKFNVSAYLKRLSYSRG